MSLSLVTLCLALVADEPIAPEKAAVIEREQQKAQAEVAAKYGNKKSSELTQDERRQMVKDQQEADKKVLEKNGVEPKQWARESIKRDRAEYAKNEALKKDLDAKEKAAEEQRKADANKPKEVEVQRGITDATPVTLDEKPNEEGKVSVEKGLPPEALQEQEQLSEAEKSGSINSVTEEQMPKPSKPAKGGGRRR